MITAILTMTKQFLVSIQLETLDSPPPGSLALISISYLGHVYFDVSPSQVTAASTFLHDHFGEFSIYCNATALLNTEDLISLLNTGATKIFITQHQLKEIIEGNLLEDLSRLVLSIDPIVNEEDPAITVKNVQKQLESLVGESEVDLYVQDVQDGKLLDMMREYRKQPESYPRACFHLPHVTRESYWKAIQDGHIPIIPASALTIDADEYPELVPAGVLVTSLLKTDRHDGLYPTVVSNERGICLGLVYSSEESIHKAVQSGAGVYYSRSHEGLWVKGATSGDTQELIAIGWDCDADALQFTVKQRGTGRLDIRVAKSLVTDSSSGFCHLQTATCFGRYSGLSRLEHTLQARRASAPAKSYTARLFKEPKLLQAKIMEEANELCEASNREDIAAEAADQLYFALTKCVAADVDLAAVERNLDLKSMKTTRRKGDAKAQWAQKVGLHEQPNRSTTPNGLPNVETVKEAASMPKDKEDPAGLNNGRIQMRRYKTLETEPSALATILQRPSQRSTDQIMNIVNPIIKDIQVNGDNALLRYTHKFEKATSLTSPVLKSPFPDSLMQLRPETISAIDTSFENIRLFHAAQRELKPLLIETMPGVSCSRFSRPIERVGLYVPGGTAVLPSTALMLGVPAMVAGCKKIVLASPPRSDGTITPEIVYIAHKVGAESIVLAGGAQAIAALAYGTESVSKVDKILGPGNQFVTAGKMIVSNDTSAGVSIDMPAGPSEVLVIADKTAVPAFVASDLLSQAEHGSDSQVVLITVGLGEEGVKAIEAELHAQASALPRVDIVRGAIEHSVTLEVESIEEAVRLSNQYAPEHLILQVKDAEKAVDLVDNAGSVFIGPWTPESVGDYSAGVNHSLRELTRSILSILSIRYTLLIRFM